MRRSSIQRPDPDEYDAYYDRYIRLVPDGDLVRIMSKQLTDFTAFVAAIPGDKADFAYAPGKWTVREVLGHLIDTERLFMYRALSIARGDPAALPGMDQDAWCANGSFGGRTIGSLATEWTDARRASISFVAGLPEEATTRMGTASGKTVSVRALLFMPAGHVSYHVDLLRKDYGLR